MTYDDYRKIDAVNWSSLKSIGISPLQYWHDLHNPRADAAHFRIGQALHAHILEPETFTERFWLHKKQTGKGSRLAEAAARAQATAAGVTMLSEVEYKAALGAAASVLASPHAAALLSRGLKEAVLRWTDEDSGLPLKARVDHAGRCLIDLKSAARIDPRRFASTAIGLGYHCQLAFYEDGLRANGIEPAEVPHLIVVESSLPHDVIVYRMPTHVIETGRHEYKALLAKLKQCRETGHWPGRAEAPIDFIMPAWAGVGDDSDDGDLIFPDTEEGDAA